MVSLSASDSLRTDVVRWVRAVPIIFIVVGFTFGTWLSRIPAIRDHLGATPTEMSRYVLCLAAGSVVALIISGNVIQRFGPRKVLLVAGIAAAFTLPIAAIIILSGPLAVGFAVLVLFGFSFSISDVAMNVSGANAEAAFGLPRMPLMHAGYSLGAVAATGFGALAETFGVSVPLHFVVAMAVSTAVLLVSLRYLPHDETAVRVASTGSAAAVVEPVPTTTGSIAVVAGAASSASAQPLKKYSPWRDPRILVAGLITLSFGLFEGTAADWLPLALVDGRGFDNALGSAMLSAFFLAAMTTRVAGTWLLMRFSREAVLRASAIITAIGLAITIAAPGDIAAMAGVLIWGVGGALGWPITISAAADNPETAARAVGAVSALGYGSMLLGPIAFGFLGEHFGLLTGFWALLPFAIFVIFAARAVRPPVVHGVSGVSR